ncbi:MAG: DUF389 domain-containing protein [Spirulinaceae cyanobacterium]
MYSKLSSLVKQTLPNPPDIKRAKRLHQELWNDAGWDADYVVLTHTSCLIATFGLISNSAAVIIGAMLVAPLMLPLRGLAFSALEGDLSLFRKALLAIMGGTLISIVLSSLIGLIAGIPEFQSEILNRTQPNLIDLGIAVAAGLISGFAKLRPRLSDALAGTAISVALMPPLCVVGLSLSQGYASLATGAFLLYVTNLLGITLACMLVFIIAGYAKMNHALGVTFGLTAILVFPLGASFLQLVEKAQLEKAIQDKLVRETVTVGQQEVELLRTKVNWTTQPPIVYLSLQVGKQQGKEEVEITPKQVQEVEKFISAATSKNFELVFLVNDVKIITAQEYQQVEPEQVPITQSEPLQKDIKPQPSEEKAVPETSPQEQLKESPTAETSPEVEPKKEPKEILPPLIPQ